MAQGYVNDRTTDYLSLKNRLMAGASGQQRLDHFDVLNRHLRPGLMMGSAAWAFDFGTLGAALARKVCTVVLAVATKGQGSLTCAVIGGAGAGYLGGDAGGAGGALLGGKILEIDGDVIFQPEGA